MSKAFVRPPAGACCVVQVSIDSARIRAGFADEKPPVSDGEWDVDAYVADRTAAYRTALEGVTVPEAGMRFDVWFGTPAEANEGLAQCIELRCALGDRVRVVPASRDGDANEPAQAPTRETLEALAHAVATTLRPLFADIGAWRRFLLPDYFARHRAWRSAVGGPIQH